ncbi:SOS response-associated peptidase family protein [Epibacterium ulvae]|uniref:SOS response-associated peptidase family protein n=1 Tax=Epibacterium ulvae TaxID=1156985 RepID=UPI000B7CC99F
MFFAGLYAPTSEGLTCSILTRSALTQIEQFHSRSPVIVTEGVGRRWIGGGVSDDEAISKFGTSWDGRMRFHRVRRFKRDEDRPKLIVPIDTLI